MAEAGKPVRPVVVLDDGEVIALAGVADATLYLAGNRAELPRLSVDFNIETADIIAFGPKSSMK